MSYIFYSPVSAPYQKTAEMLRYATVNCPSYIKNDLTHRRDEDSWYYRFYFSDEKDYLLFNLKWA
jgi:hypothetical protein